MLEKIHKFLFSFLLKKHFTFRFQYYFETDVVSDTNVIEYEFINVGRTSVFVNDLELLPVQLGVPVGSPVGNIINRALLSCNYNEEDTTIYRIKFPPDNSPACLKTCSGKLTLQSWLVCPAGIPQCEFIAQIFVGAIAITNPFSVNCNTGDTALIWQQSIDNNMAGGFPVGSIVVVFIPTASPTNFDVEFNFVNLSFPCDQALGQPTMTLNGTGMLCPLYTQTTEPLFCIIPPPPPPAPKGKLLVISKVKAGLKSNP